MLVRKSSDKLKETLRKISKKWPVMFVEILTELMQILKETSKKV